MTEKKFLSHRVYIETGESKSCLGLTVVTVRQSYGKILSVSAEPFERESEGVEFVDGEINIIYDPDGEIYFRIADKLMTKSEN